MESRLGIEFTRPTLKPSSHPPHPGTMNTFLPRALTPAWLIALLACSAGAAAQPSYTLPDLFSVEGEVFSEPSPDAVSRPADVDRERSVRPGTFVGGFTEDDNAGAVLTVGPPDHAGRGRGVRLTKPQREALRRTLRYSRGHDVGPRGVGQGRHRHKVIRLPESLDELHALQLWYGPETGLTDSPGNRGGGWMLLARDTLETLDDVTYSWSGTLYAEGNLNARIGSALFVYSAESGFSGTVRVRADTWTLAPLGGGLHVFVDVDEGKIKPIISSPLASGGGAGSTPLREGFLFTDPPSASVHDFGSASSAEADGREVAHLVEASQSAQLTTDISVLALWTSGAASSGIDVNTRIIESINQANAIYRASALDNTRLVLAHKQLLSGFNETPVPFVPNVNVSDIGKQDLDRLAANATVQSLRDRYSADIVVLFTRPDAYRNPYTGGILLGRVNDIPNLSAFDPNVAFALVNLAEATLDETFAHEVGHLQGGQHHPDNLPNGQTDPVKGAPYGRGYKAEWDNCWWIFGWACGNHKFSTTMAYSDDGFGRVGHISNPDVTEQGQPTGVEDSFDNARVIDFSDYHIARYRVAPLTASIRLSGTNGYYTLTAVTTGGSSSTNRYEWAISEGTPGNYTVVSTQYSFTRQFALGTTYVRLRVWGGPGESATAYRTVTYETTPICEIKPFLPECDDVLNLESSGPELAASVAALETSLGVYPNPVAESGTVRYELAEGGPVRISVYDVQGREVAVVVDGTVEPGSYSAAVPVGSLAAGVYAVRMSAGSDVLTRRLTVVR